MIVSLFFFALWDKSFKWKGKEEQEHHLLVYAFGFNKRYFHLLKVFAILVFFKYHHAMHIYILYTKKIGGCSTFACLLLFCSVSLLWPKIFSWEMNFFLLLVNASKLLGNCPLCVFKIVYAFWEDTKRISN